MKPDRLLQLEVDDIPETVITTSDWLMRIRRASFTWWTASVQASFVSLPLRSATITVLTRAYNKLAATGKCVDLTKSTSKRIFLRSTKLKSFYRATRMRSADYAVERCPYVTRRYSVETAKRIIESFSQPGSHTILVFHTKRDGNSPTETP